MGGVAITVDAFALGTIARVVIESQRATRTILRAFQWIGMTMVGEISGGEDNKASEVGPNACLAFLHVLRPQLQVTSEAILPIGVQKDEGIHTTMQIVLLVTVEIGMDGKIAAGKRLVHARATVMRIRNDVFNVRQTFKELDEKRRLHKAKKGTRGRSMVLVVFEGILSLLVFAVETFVVIFGTSLRQAGIVRNLANRSAQHRFREKTVVESMGVRLSALVLRIIANDPR